MCTVIDITSQSMRIARHPQVRLRNRWIISQCRKLEGFPAGLDDLTERLTIIVGLGQV